MEQKYDKFAEDAAGKPTEAAVKLMRDFILNTGTAGMELLLLIINTLFQ